MSLKNVDMNIHLEFMGFHLIEKVCLNSNFFFTKIKWSHSLALRIQL